LLGSRNEAFSLASYIQELKDNNNLLKKQLDDATNERNFLKNTTLASKRYNSILKKTIDNLKSPTSTATRLSITKIEPAISSMKSVFKSP